MNNELVSIVVPSRQEKFLQRTILDILEKATGPIEIFPVLDGYEPPVEEIINDPRVHYIRIPNMGRMQKRQAVNCAASIANGKYFMSVDAHCMFAKGFDEVLKADHQPNWIQIPRRHRLEANSWTLEDGPDQPPIDYEYWMWNAFTARFHNFGELHGYKWNERTIARKDILVDETMTMQASCWFMELDWFKKIGFEVEGYTGWGQEAEELCLKTWSAGGKVMTNKKTFYAHLHKGSKHGRMYFMSKAQRDESCIWSYRHWVIENTEAFGKVIDRFMPIPGWKSDWKNYIVTTGYVKNGSD
jgi:hypothetical protein